QGAAKGRTPRTSLRWRSHVSQPSDPRKEGYRVTTSPAELKFFQPVVQNRSSISPQQAKSVRSARCRRSTRLRAVACALLTFMKRGGGIYGVNEYAPAVWQRGSVPRAQSPDDWISNLGTIQRVRACTAFRGLTHV